MASYSTREGQVDDIDEIIEISARVQAKLTAAGSLQEIGPLKQETLASAVEGGRCFVIENTSDSLLGCALVKNIGKEHFQTTSEFSIAAFPEPWRYIHSIMLKPEAQGQGIGVQLFEDVIRHIEPSGGTAFLDCWAGNDKLRDFYERSGCTYLATVPENDYKIAVFARTMEMEGRRPVE